MTPASARQGGFTLLEAVVALALFAAAALPLYALFNRSLDGLFRVAETNRMSEARLMILAMLDNVNPSEQPTGTERIGGYVVRWQSRELVPPIDNIGYPRGVGIFQVGLYDIAASVERDGQPWFNMNVRQVGYRKVRDLVPFGIPQRSG
jgi:prepilin-type N-terminal cleavage/methylation domain-containing protein